MLQCNGAYPANMQSCASGPSASVCQASNPLGRRISEGHTHVSVPTTLKSPPGSAGKLDRVDDDNLIAVGHDDLKSVIPKDKLDYCMRIFAASANHMSGAKIVDRSAAAALDVAQLQKTRDTLKTLIRARSEVGFLLLIKSVKSHS